MLLSSGGMYKQKYEQGVDWQPDSMLALHAGNLSEPSCACGEVWMHVVSTQRTSRTVPTGHNTTQARLMFERTSQQRHDRNLPGGVVVQRVHRKVQTQARLVCETCFRSSCARIRVGLPSQQPEPHKGPGAAVQSMAAGLGTSALA
jgi:hypothetical protein